MEQTSNNATALINVGGGINNSTTSLTVDTEVNTPATGTFRAIIESEIIWVTAVAAHVWTIVRGQEGTSAASHADNTIVYVILTKEAMDRIVNVQLGGVDTSNRRSLNFDADRYTVTDNSGSTRADITEKSWTGEVYVKPVYADFTFDGHSLAGTPTATQQGASVYLYHPGVNGDSIIEFYKAAPATPYTIIAKLETIALASWNAITGALYFGDGTKLYGVGLQANNNSLTVVRWNSVTSFSLAPITLTNGNQSRIVWFRIQDNGPNRIWSASIDGLNWIVLLTEGRTTFMGASTRVGIMINGNTGGTNTGRVTGLSFQSWAQS